MPFASDCSCEGPVEAWLQNVVDAMRGAIGAEFKAAMPAYAEKARTQWIFENSAQNTIVVSRAFFTQEVNEAFKELENGNEDALKVGTALALASALYHCYINLRQGTDGGINSATTIATPFLSSPPVLPLS